MKATWATISLLIVAPIWFYLLYKILHAVEATDLMWFLFWIYIPASIIMGILGKVLDQELSK